MPHRAIYIALALCWALSLSGCTMLSSSDPDQRAGSQPLRYESRLRDADAKAYYYFSLAIMRHNQGDLDGVVEALGKTLEYDPHTPALRLYLAEIYLQLQRDAEAIRALEDVLIDDPGSIQAHRLIGEVLLEEQRVDLAIKHFRQLIQLQPEDVDPVLLLVQALARRGDTIEAIEVLKEFLAKHDDSYRAHYALARLYLQIDLTVAAEQEYRKVIAMQSTLLPVYLELGRLYEKRQQSGDLDRAIALYREGLLQRPAEPGLRHRLVQVLLTQEQYPEALKELEKILADNRDDPEALRKYGLLQMEQQHWPEAARSFERLLTLTEERDSIRYFLGNVYENSAQPYEALREFLQIQQSSDLFPDARIHAAYLYPMLGEMEQAFNALVPLLDDPRLTVDQVLLMTSLAADGGFTKQALQMFQRGEQRFPGNTRIIYLRGTLLEKIGMRDAARLAMEEILELDPYNSDAMNFIAYQYAEDGVHLDRALVLAQRALELNEAGHIYDTLGWVYYRLGRYKEALETLLAALREMPDDPVIHEHLGDLHVALGEPDKARSYYRKALDIEPDNVPLQQKIEALP